MHEADLLHQQSSRHRPAVEQSRICGYFFCLELFAPTEIRKWTDRPVGGTRGPGQTAICPRCGVDAVLPEGDGLYPMGVELLRRMHGWWFGES